MEIINSRQLEESYRQHHRGLKIYAYQFCKNHVLAEEAVQVVFTKLFEKSTELQINSSLTAYLYRAVRNQSLNLKQENSKTIPLPADIDFEEEIILESNDLDLATLEKAIWKLPHQCQTILVKKRIENKSYKQIAEELGISAKTVENQMGIALKKLREYFKMPWGK